MNVDKLLSSMVPVNCQDASREELLRVIEDQNKLFKTLAIKNKKQANSLGMAAACLSKLMNEKGITSYTVTKDDCIPTGLSIEKSDEGITFKIIND